MATLKKITTTRWLDGAGNRVLPDTPGASKVREESAKWYIVTKEDGKLKRIPAYTDKAASQKKLSDHLRARERGEAGLSDPHKLHKDAPIGDHLRDYFAHVDRVGRTARYRREMSRILNAVVKGAGVKLLRDLTAERIDDYLTRMTQASRTVGKHRSTVHAFAAWLAGKKRLPANPLTHTLKPKDTPARQPRAFTAEELGRLLVAARERSLAEAAVNKGGRTRKDGTRPAASVAKLSDEARADRIRSGRERELVYRMSALTGLRRGELGALVACDLSLTDCPMVRIPAFDPHTRERLVKNGQAVVLPLVPTLAADLASWVADTGKQPGDRVFDVPTLKTFKADMRHAGIPYKDARGRTADFHSLRRSTATMLALAGISPKEAQVFMRHSDIRLTLQTYTDAAIIGTANAAAALANVRF